MKAPMSGILPALLIALCLTGCDRTAELWMSATDKVTRAFPLPDGLELAANRLLADGEATTDTGTDVGRAALRAGWQRQLELRALKCSPPAAVRWWHSVAALRAQAFDVACLRKQDERLADWVGVHRVGQILRLPPLVPMAPLGERRPLLDVTALFEIHAAAQANVAVVKDTRGRFSSVDLTSGKLLHSLDIVDGAHTGVELSPNGRLVALPLANRRGLQVIDVANGNLLWKTDRFNAVLAWLPKLDAAVASLADGRGLALLDLRSGRDQAYYDASRRITWAIPAAGAEGAELWLVGASSLTQVMHSRRAAGELESSALASWPLQRQATSLRPLLMQSGRRMLYLTTRDLAWIDLHSGDQGVYELSALNGNGYAKLDEDRLLLDTGGVGTVLGTTSAQVLDVASKTLAPVERYVGDDGLLLPMTVRAGFMRRGFELSYVADQVGPIGPPRPAQRAIADAQLRQQLARLNARAAAEAAAGISPPISATRGFADAAAAIPPAPPLLGRVPAQAQVAIVGVYEGSGHRVPGGAPVRISVPPSSTPLVLVLSSYESVRWLVHNSGRPISAVLLSGYSPSTVLGTGDVPVLRIGSTYAYQLADANYAQLKQDIARYVSNRVDSFQGQYRGTEFSIPNR